MDATFTFTNAIQLFTLLCAGAGALLAVWWRIELRIRAVEDNARTRVRDAEIILAAKALELDKDLTSYKLHVAERYASWETVKEMQTRFDTLSRQVHEMPDIVAERIMKFMAMKQS